MTEGEMQQNHRRVKFGAKKGRRRGFSRKGLANEPHLHPCDPDDSHDCRQVEGVTLTGASEAKTPRQAAKPARSGQRCCGRGKSSSRNKDSRHPLTGLVRRCTRLFAYLRGADQCLTSLQVWQQCIISLFTSFLHGGGRAYSPSGRSTLLKFPQQIASRTVPQSHVQPCSLHHNSSGGRKKKITIYNELRIRFIIITFTNKIIYKMEYWLLRAALCPDHVTNFRQWTWVNEAGNWGPLLPGFSSQELLLTWSFLTPPVSVWSCDCICLFQALSSLVFLGGFSTVFSTAN